jgi:uncharacterized membrane protein
MDLFYNQLKISKNEFLFQFQSHPNYPTALAFSDTLNFLNINNDVYEIPKEKWDDLPKKFIIFYKNKYTIVEKLNKDFLIYNDKKEKISKENLYNDSEDIVFIFDETSNTNDEKKINYKWIINFFFAFILTYSIFHSHQYLFVYNLLSALGLYISLELFNAKFGNESHIINTFCTNNSIKTSDYKNNCSKIFNSDKISFFDLKLSDFSLVYFLGILILGVFVKEIDYFLKFISILSIFIILYSLYIQIFVEKTYCKICISIIFILILQIFISTIFFSNIFNYNLFFIVTFCFVSIFFFVLYNNDVLVQKQKYYGISLKSIKFKKNYDIFKKVLKAKHYKLKIKNDEFLLGNRNSKLQISLITNPYCGFCQNATLLLKKILIKYPQISIQLRFNYFANNTDENLKFIISIFRNIYKNQDEMLLFDAIEFWHNNDIDIFKEKYNSFIYETEMNEIIKLAEENKNFEFTYTPQILINNYHFPNLYEREDIFLFIDDLLEDDEILNNNNA